MLKPEKCWYITISGHDNISPIMMIYVKIQEKASKTRAFITRRVTNFFIFYFLHKSFTEFMVADVFGFVVSRRALTKNIAQKLEPLDIIHFQAMQSKTINNIKK